MEFKRSVLGAVVIGAAAFSGSALAAATGNVGGFSEYMFRGVEQSNGAAVQGGLDYAHSSGLYVGTWISNTDFAGYKSQVTYETDVYGGRSEEHTSELQSLMRNSYAAFCLKKKKYTSVLPTSA